ncbi:MAG TPA: decarboxylating 6-phosphogluconate dehydrogenase [Rubricoccaceae bacterium]|nr:decarboxylating 6-phosphogluconate dehydrogenase [Rubricoccaceae bacterium]
MHLGMIGLGRMGLGLAARLLKTGHTVVGTDRNADTVADLVTTGGQAANDVASLAGALSAGPRAFWMMVPAGAPVDGVLAELGPHLRAGDVVIDGGNSFYQDSQRRAAALGEAGIAYLDVGVSGGIWGEENGFCLMVGGDAEAAERLRPLFQALAPAPDKGWAYVGPSGAGHFTKMVHNGIEYGLMEAYAEGFALMKAKTEFDLDLAQVAALWQEGGVIRSWLLGLAGRALATDGTLEHIQPVVADSGMGRWTSMEAIALGVPLPVLTLALHERFTSRDAVGFAHRLLAALRHEFGGHAIVSTPARDPVAEAPPGAPAVHD